jgi:BirA family biotin operon repressor/biotin-[acetyl-CoA-carboxylase] ligase
MQEESISSDMLYNPTSKTDNPKRSNPLSSENIQEGLRTHWLGKGLIRCYKTIDSTNNEAKRLAHAGALEGTIILAESQHQGKGRMGRTWISPPGEGIYLSAVLRPCIVPAEVQKLTLVAAVALAFTFRHFGIISQIKWPNDILVNGKKAAGILMELITKAGQIDFVIVGIGVNVNTSIDELPLSIRNLATSINMVTSRPIPRQKIIQVLLMQLESWYKQFLTGPFEMILEEWKRLSYTLGTHVTVTLSDGKLEGVAEAVGSDGALMVRDDKGGRHRVIAGDVVYCRSLLS